MKFSAFSLMAAVLAAKAAAEDLLFTNSASSVEYTTAVRLGYSVKIVSATEWRSMSTADFAQYKAVVFGEGDSSFLNFADDTKKTWSPAILGNMVIIGKSHTKLQNHTLKWA